MWESLFEGPEPSEGLREMWAEGLGTNPAAPDDLRRALLGRSRYLLWCRLSASVVDAAVAHPEWEVRALLAEHQPNLTAEHWTRLILGEQKPRNLWVLTMFAADRRDGLTEAAYERAATAPSAHIRAEATRPAGLPVRLLTALARDPEPGVRAAACPRAWPHLDGAARQGLLADPEGTVRVAAPLRHHEEQPLSRSVFEAEDLGEGAVQSCHLTRDLAEHLTHHGTEAQRWRLACNLRLTPELVAVLAQDTDSSVRHAVAVRPELTEEQRADIRVDIDPSARSHTLAWVKALHDDPEAMRRLAASSHLLVRRSVARAKRLPPDVVERLARDEDRVVHLFLAESCDDAPADLLMGVWQWWTGSLTCPDRPRGHPNFPRHGLLRYADDPSPRMRRLALDDPASTPELVERFARDADNDVRRRAAEDPRLPVDSAVRLLDDPEWYIRWMALRHPGLPVPVLVRLLRDPATAENAAAHPTLPVDVMWRMIRQP
ncbi:PE-PGRS family protein [Streptomyces sp. ME19-01-6]|uniref:HEAT repeat domain-containing protein n=1 Tax=Streptomyces sp. ME19-01-6 TaxID=3028686 RepID=UPI0029B12A2E|nr:PE-PGRS family protein [Streptomyces sp. ME19-01-6]MDX3226099.1 PE-PGRS family protein [Streptomyces sp. ME19-01-6]